MLDFKQKNRFRRALYAKPTIICLIAILGFMAKGAWGMYEKSATSNTNKERAQEELAALLVREKILNQDIIDLSSDRGVDEKIRERFMVAKEGESVMVIANPKVEKTYTITVNDEEAP